MVFNKNFAEFPASQALRIVYFAIFISALIILDHYSAILISRLTYPIPIVYLPDMESFVESGNYKLITLKNGADYNIFEVIIYIVKNSVRFFKRNFTNYSLFVIIIF